MYALITGASAGIGKIFAHTAAHRGFQGLLLVARRRDRLEALQGELREGGYTGEVRVIQCDLRSTTERTALYHSISSLPIELLVNNAGFGFVGKFLADSPENILDMVETNCSAPLHLSRLLLPGMVARGRGGIINVASVAAYPPIPYMAEYGATKALLLNWSVALREELRGTGVQVLALCPGPTESDFHLVAGVRDKIDIVPAMSAERVVSEAFTALARGQAIQINGLQNRLLAEATRLFPKGIIAKIARVLLRSHVPHDRL